MSVAIGTLFDVKKMFFDRAAVINATNKADRKALGHIGGEIRKTAKRSIKKAPKGKSQWKTAAGEHFLARAPGSVSAPGSPPVSHTGRLKKGILYGYDKDRNSVVVGPTLWRTSEPLELLEYGGTTTRNKKPARYRARPFMGPAMEKSAPFDRFWQDSVK